MRKPKLNDWIQGIIAVVLLCNLIYFWIQVDLTKKLNQPICAVRGIDWKVTPVVSKDEIIDVLSFTATLVNSGNFAAHDATVTWKWYTFKDGVRKETNLQDIRKNRIFVLPPKQQVSWLLFHEQARKTRERICGYDKYDEVEISVEYLDIDKQSRRYWCLYRIMRLMSCNLDVYDPILIRSIYDQRGQSMAWKWLLGVGLGLSFAGLVVMVHARRYKTNDGKMWDCVHGNIHPKLNYLGWFLTGAGFVLQIIGIAIT